MTFQGRLGILTYSTKPRGGVVHSLELAEALQARGNDVHLFALGGPGESFFRPTSVPFTLFPAIEGATTLDDKVFASVDSMARGLATTASAFDLLHAQDCISARAAARVRDAGAGPRLVRTVHHVDDFTTAALIDCQRKAILEPDHVLVVSRAWQETLLRDYGVDAQIVHNGVRTDRFPPISDEVRSQLRDSVRAEDRTVLLAVGGVEPRKGSRELFEAVGLLRARGRRVVLVILGGHSFQDYEAYRLQTLALLPGLGLCLGDDVHQIGTVDDLTLAQWFRAADILAYPSVKEGFGLVALEALAADLPVVASSIPVFSEFLTDHVNALLPRVSDPVALANALEELILNPGLRERLVAAGREVVPRYTWDASAARHEQLYPELL
ncbi:MAG: MSMEG_0565 family glycosyltransferase [Actinobacteria bacterium]|nr:MSMEG_0565 family glycosyltransferase [Actinomycetota bacterium]